MEENDIDIVTIDGVVYKSYISEFACKDCAGRNTTTLCESLPPCAGIVWKKVEIQTPLEDSNVEKEPTKTLRDEFAMAALTGFCSRGDIADRAKMAYRIADDMLRIRKE